MDNTLSEKHTNVIFFTNDCQLDCEYCYEKLNRSPSDIFYTKFEDIKDKLDTLGKNDFSNDIVIFGGEPTMAMDEIYRSIEYVNNEYSGKFNFYMNTNCVLLSNSDFFNRFKDFYTNNKNIIVTFSYDGCANFRRKFRNSDKDSTECVLKCIKMFSDNCIPYNISYCLNMYNYDNCVRDFVYILKQPFLNRLVISRNNNELMDYLKVDLAGLEKLLKETLFPKCLYLYQKFNIPICDMTCVLCRTCNKSKGYNYILPNGSEYKTRMENFDLF